VRVMVRITEKINAREVLVGKPKKSDRLEDLDVHGRLILKLSFNK
jgi:hypothetical protein